MSLILSIITLATTMFAVAMTFVGDYRVAMLAFLVGQAVWALDVVIFEASYPDKREEDKP